MRDPVVADIVLPRFLAPGDHALAALNLEQCRRRARQLRRDRHDERAGGAARRRRRPSSTQTLRVGQRVLVPVAIDGSGIGIANITLNVSGPGGFNVTHRWPIEVRAPQLDIARDEIVPLGAKAELHRQQGARRRPDPGHAERRR